MEGKEDWYFIWSLSYRIILILFRQNIAQTCVLWAAV